MKIYHCVNLKCFHLYSYKAEKCVICGCFVMPLLAEKEPEKRLLDDRQSCYVQAK